MFVENISFVPPPKNRNDGLNEFQYWERRWLMRELVVRTGQFVRFDPHDFVAVQEEALAAWAPIAQRMKLMWLAGKRSVSTRASQFCFTSGAAVSLQSAKT